MGKYARPQRVYDFAAASMRMAPIPGDRLDAQLANHAEAIVKVQLALEALDAPLTADRLDPKFIKHIVAEAKASLEQLASDSARAAGRAASAAQLAANAAVKAETASAPILARAQALLAEERNALRELELQAQAIVALERKLEDLERRPALREPTDPVGVLGPNAGGKHSADALGANATAADYADVATHWAEWMGPGGLYGGSSHTAASDVIPANILAINAITGQHWSSRWWAHRAAEAAGGQLAYLYLGPYPTPPLTTPNGGPIPLGAIYWNTSNASMYVWNGTNWAPFNSPTKAATSSLFYNAAANQTVFNLGTADLFGSSHTLDPAGSEGTEVYFNGVRLTPTLDYSVNPAANTITLVNPAPAGSVVGIDVLTDPSLMSPNLALTGKLRPWAFDGVATTYPLISAAGVAVFAVDASQLFIVIDGVDQEPGVDFTLDVIGSSVIFLAPPAQDAKSYTVMMLRSGTGFLSVVEHDLTLTGDGTTTLPLGVVPATPLQRGGVIVPGLAALPPNPLTVGPQGELGVATTTAIMVAAGVDGVNPVTSLTLRSQTGADAGTLLTPAKTIVPALNETYGLAVTAVQRAGDVMTGALNLPAPTNPTEATNKAYVDQAIAASALYQGVWHVAANNPDLTPAIMNPLNGWSWIAQTVNPDAPEIAPPGLPGVSGSSIDSGDRVLWDAGGAVYSLVKGSSLSINEASALFVDVAGDAMTGELILPGNPVGLLSATDKTYVDAADALRVLKAGDAMTGQLNTIAPVNPAHAANKGYVDATIASLNLYQGQWRVAANVPDLNVPPNVPLNGYSWVATTVDPNVAEIAPGGLPGIGSALIFNGDTIKWNAGLGVYEQLQGSSLTIAQGDQRYVLITGDVMTGPLVLPLADPTLPAQAANKSYVDMTVANSALYQGIWNVATNQPDLAPATANPLNGYSWVAQTVNPNTPEIAPPGLPGVSGQLIDSGWTVRWNAGLALYELIRGPALSVTTAQSLFVSKVGDTMTGALNMSNAGVAFGSVTGANAGDQSKHITLWGDPLGVASNFGFGITSGRLNYNAAAASNAHWFRGNNVDWTAITSSGVTTPSDGQGYWTNGGGAFYKRVGTGITIRCHTGNTQPGIENNDGSNRRDIIDTANGDARYGGLATVNGKVNKTGDTMTGVLNMNSNYITNVATPGTNAGDAANKGYVDANTGANRVLKAGDTMTDTLTLSGISTMSFNARCTSSAQGAVSPRFLFSDPQGTLAYMEIHKGSPGFSTTEAPIYQYMGCGGYGMYLLWNSNVASPPQFYVNGNLSAGSVTNRCTRDLKATIRSALPNEHLAAFNALKVRRFTVKGEQVTYEVGRERWGFVAEELPEETVAYAAPGTSDPAKQVKKVEGVDLGQLLALAVAEIKRLGAKVEALETAQSAGRTR